MFVRITLAAGALLGMPLFSAPPLTTIQDVLYRADGTRFNGTLQINWNSFEAADTSNITMQGLSVRVVDGALRVQLVPNISAGPKSYYSVKYNSDGKVQFQETWAVPQSINALRVREVRVNSPAALQSVPGPLQETDVVGLLADLGTRAMKGAGFAPGRAALIDSAGLLAGVTGDPADCVHVDGSAGPCTDPNAQESTDGETPGGIVDGANASFGLDASPDATSTLVYRNGLLQKLGQDYAILENTIQFVPANVPQPGDTLLASYKVSGGAGYASAKRAVADPLASAGPQVLCAGTGNGTGQASCPLADGTLQAGDRVEVRFEYARAGTSGSFSWEIHWGAVTVASGNSTDALITGRLDAAGTLPATIDFRGSDALLRSFSVLRFPRK